MEIWEKILVLTVTPSAVIAAVAYIVRKLFDRGLQRDLEKYKSDLELQRFEHQSKVSLINEKRAEVIGILYGRIAKARRLMAQLTHIFQEGGQSLVEKKKQTADACNKADNYFNEHRIYLNQNTSEKLDLVFEKIKSAFISFDIAQPGEEYKPDQTGLWRESSKEIRKELSPLLEDLEREFRDLLGMGEKEKP